jgi:hypothetical protein
MGWYKRHVVVCFLVPSPADTTVRQCRGPTAYLVGGVLDLSGRGRVAGWSGGIDCPVRRFFWGYCF